MAGTYDANVNLLRTCSLPDLKPLLSDSPEAETPWGDNLKDPPNDLIYVQNKDEICNDEDDEDSDPDKPNEVDSEPENEQEGVSEEEESDPETSKKVSDEEEEEEVWSSSEDDDLQQLVQSLQSFVEDSSEFTNILNIIVSCDSELNRVSCAHY